MRLPLKKKRYDGETWWETTDGHQYLDKEAAERHERKIQGIRLPHEPPPRVTMEDVKESHEAVESCRFCEQGYRKCAFHPWVKGQGRARRYNLADNLFKDD